MNNNPVEVEKWQAVVAIEAVAALFLLIGAFLGLYYSNFLSKSTPLPLPIQTNLAKMISVNTPNAAVTYITYAGKLKEFSGNKVVLTGDDSTDRTILLDFPVRNPIKFVLKNSSGGSSVGNANQLIPGKNVTLTITSDLLSNSVTEVAIAMNP